ncbi:hypothetical protein GOBAR_AA10290 [Gossypium barbadense]|uniref:Uncharacterized protein n=1 Tax=Gossypium barbadense TaxID=3634 RepID=A0A2P5Y434_GOSBA|nr:hypothetical protein GOBAR_AA10290 [Gossypium barbadense]
MVQLNHDDGVDIAELRKLKQMLDKAKQELKSKDDALRKSVENFHNLEDKAEGKDQLCNAKEEKPNELENQLSSKTELCCGARAQTERTCSAVMAIALAHEGVMANNCNHIGTWKAHIPFLIRCQSAMSLCVQSKNGKVVVELWVKKGRRNLAGEEAKEIGVLQVSIACGAEVAGASEPLIYKYQFCTVYYV